MQPNEMELICGDFGVSWIGSVSEVSLTAPGACHNGCQEEEEEEEKPMRFGPYVFVIPLSKL